MVENRANFSFWKIASGVAGLAAFLLLFFFCAGRLNWVQGWVFVALLTVGQTLSSIMVWRRNPDLLIRRSRFGKGTKSWDMVLLPLFGLSYLAVLFTAALDARYGWTTMSVLLWPVGFILYLFFLVIFTWAMVSNPFFETTVRIQRERNHKVVDSGPYRLVRHPGYTAAILGFIFSLPFLLGSWSAVVPATLSSLLLVIRTVLEDRTLCQELPGYDNYRQRVRYRLLPLIW